MRATKEVAPKIEPPQPSLLGSAGSEEAGAALEDGASLEDGAALDDGASLEDGTTLEDGASLDDGSLLEEDEPGSGGITSLAL